VTVVRAVDQGQVDVASTVVDIIATSRTKNEWQATFLRPAMSCEGGIMLLVALAAVNVLAG
jgi:hypothetical protein